MHNNKMTKYIFVMQKNELIEPLPLVLVRLDSLLFLVSSKTSITFDFLHKQITTPKMLVLSPYLLLVTYVIMFGP